MLQREGQQLKTRRLDLLLDVQQCVHHDLCGVRLDVLQVLDPVAHERVRLGRLHKHVRDAFVHLRRRPGVAAPHALRQDPVRDVMRLLVGGSQGLAEDQVRQVVPPRRQLVQRILQELHRRRHVAARQQDVDDPAVYRLDDRRIVPALQRDAHRPLHRHGSPVVAVQEARVPLLAQQDEGEERLFVLEVVRLG